MSTNPAAFSPIKEYILFITSSIKYGGGVSTTEIVFDKKDEAEAACAIITQDCLVKVSTVILERSVRRI